MFGKLKEHFLYFIYRFISYLSDLFAINIQLFNTIRAFLLRLTGMKIKRNSFVDKGFSFLNPKNISICNHVSLGHNNKIWAFNKVIIGDYVQTALGMTIISGGHNTSDYSPLTEGQEVILEGENWIGANVTILGGVTIGIGTIIGAGSIVNKSLPPYTICAGNPCRVIKKREPARETVSPFGMYEPSFYNEN